MDNMEEKIGTILSNPQLMQQIMSMAQSLGESKAAKEPEEKEKQNTAAAPFDLSAIQDLSGLLQQSGIDNNQQALLHALSPYLSQDRVSRLERAMRAAKVARYASSFLGKQTPQHSTGR